MTTLEEPYPDFNFIDISTYKKNLYFLEEKAGQIVKYPLSGSSRWGHPKLWLNPKIPRLIGANSFGIDGSIWILNKNSIYNYYSGRLQNEINLEIFPAPKNLSKIFTSPTLSYFYILEPVQKRIIILNKSGQIIKQFQSKRFDNLLDFSVSSNGKIIYLLNGSKTYKIEF